jgi:hypothetical protein
MKRLSKSLAALSVAAFLLLASRPVLADIITPGEALGIGAALYGRYVLGGGLIVGALVVICVLRIRKMRKKDGPNK